MSSTGHATTRLVVLRGNSASGKSSLAMALRERPMSVVQQDHLRRIVLKERDGNDPASLAPTLIDQTVRFCLDHGKDVILEGILYADKYRLMILALLADHLGTNHVYYLDIPFEETARRHETRPLRDEFTVEAMSDWYIPADALGVPDEVVIGSESTFEETLARIHADLDAAPPGR
ncbi:AAA family ATPase [Luteipulveratus mongoliensis]|uniref:Kinase n=1 Tax=Luteipulveratus mongoliensis TaxID=571913 RepID=A0A0K1JL82_9MICO|nr:AAA family ATPase [Luteipulveratus mongoliensis]AKU17482.1 hypothetical protein VV02_19280 [Luteipulveratus mongoliensis]